MIRSDGNGSVIVSRQTGVSIGVAAMLLGGVLGFFTAWAVPGIRMQADIANHIRVDSARDADQEQRLRMLEAFRAEGNRWTAGQQRQYEREHSTEHIEERKAVMHELAQLREQLARIETKLERVR